MEHDTTTDQIAADNYFAIIPEWVLDAEISANAVRCYAVLQRYANSKNQCWPSRTLLAKRMRCSTDTVDRAIKELVKAQAVSLKPRKTEAGAPTSNVFTLHLNARGVSAPVRRGIRKDAEGVSAPVRNESKKMNQSQELLTPTEVEVIKEKPLDQQLAEQWWNSRKKKPLGKGAWWSLRSLIKAALDSEYEPQEIIDALNRQQTVPTIATFDRELQKLRPGDYHLNRRNEMIRAAQALEAGTIDNPFLAEPQQKEITQ